MNEQLLAITGPALLIAVLAVVLILGIATAYDGINVYRRTRVRAMIRRLRRPRQPQVTILIYNQGDASGLATCLQSINRSRYHSLDIVIIDNHTSITARRFIRRALSISNYPIKLYALRRHVTEEIALYSGYRKSHRGAVIIAITPDSVLPHSFVKLAVAKVLLNTERATKLAAVRNNHPVTVAALVPMFRMLSRRAIEKATALVGTRKITRRCGYAYSRQWFQKKDQPIYARYEADCMYHRSQLTSCSARHTLWLSIGALVFLGLTVSVVVAALTFTTRVPLLLSWLLISFWLAGVVWLDDSNDIRRKLTLSLCIPPSYFIVAAVILIQPVLWISQRRNSLLQAQ